MDTTPSQLSDPERDMSARHGMGLGRPRGPVTSGRLGRSELVARRGMLLIIIAALILAGAMLLATSNASP